MIYLKLLIIEQKPHALEYIEQYLSQINSNIEVVPERNLEKILTQIKELKNEKLST